MDEMGRGGKVKHDHEPQRKMGTRAVGENKKAAKNRWVISDFGTIYYFFSARGTAGAGDNQHQGGRSSIAL